MDSVEWSCHTSLGSYLSVLHPNSFWKGLHQLHKVVHYPVSLELAGSTDKQLCYVVGHTDI